MVWQYAFTTAKNISYTCIYSYPLPNNNYDICWQVQEEEPSSFTVKLVKYADDSKIKLIKEVKSLIEGMNLVQVW